MSAYFKRRLSASLQYVSSVAICQLSPFSSCHLSCQLTCSLSAQLQFANSAVNSAVNSGATCQLSCQLRCNLSAQLHPADRLDPLPSLNSILPPKLWGCIPCSYKSKQGACCHCALHDTPCPTTRVPSLSNIMILECVYRRHDWTAVTSYEVYENSSSEAVQLVLEGNRNHEWV